MLEHFEADPQPEAHMGAALDPIAGLKYLFVERVMRRRMAAGQDPVQRPVFLKPHGVARAQFVICPDLPEHLRVGIFNQHSFDAWVRFSSDTVPSQPDFQTTLGVAIKLFGVPGDKLLEPHARTQDFLLQNHDVFFVDTAQDMYEFTYAGVAGGGYDAYLQAHPHTKQILQDMQKGVSSVLETAYWSGLPYNFGQNQHVKYKLEPIPAGSPPSLPESPNDPTYLHEDLRARLLEQEVRFKFCIQLQNHPESMPLDQATVRWDESLSSPVHVATLIFPQQDIEARGQAQYGENLSFNPWHGLAEHQPVGSLSEARKVVYQAAAELRRSTNGIPLAEPVRPPLSQDEEGGKPIQLRDTRIVRAAIHPAIGIARVGNSQEDYFLAPEVTDPAPEPVGFYKDATGALKRQVARFRLYGYNAAGEVVSELTANNADIHWQVHVANQKAAWYQFQLALDIPEAAVTSSLNPEETLLRNSTNVDIEGVSRIPTREELTIDPGARIIQGRNVSGPEYYFDSGKFFNQTVYLGELRTDEMGRLLFFGGRGVAASVHGLVQPTTFANNDGWHDDISDGPVEAEVFIKGRAIPVEPAWVVVAPPNYAPQLKGLRTMYDLLTDTFVQEGRLALPTTLSFRKDIYPLFRRMSDLQWVNQGFATQFGVTGPYDFTLPTFIRRLGDNSKDKAPTAFRNQIFTLFRDGLRDGSSPVPWPWIYGDAMNIPFADTPRQNLALGPTQYQMLKQWADGNFEADWTDETPALPTTLELVTLADQPAMLDRAALDFCLADAFHPGCEMTWVMRHGSLYSSPFRIRWRESQNPELSYGAKLTQEMVLKSNGPLFGQGPGTITRWMAVPWHTDTASCRSGYYAGYGPRYDPSVPTFWPARVPNEVLTEADYDVVMDTTKSREERLKAFQRRAKWPRGLGKNDYQEIITSMVHNFHKLGVVEVRPGVEGDSELSTAMLVESKPDFSQSVPPTQGMLLMNLPEKAVSDTAHPAGAVSAVVEATGLDESEIVVGIIDKIRRFKNVR